MTNEQDRQQKNFAYMERIMDYFLGTTGENKAIIWKRLIAIMTISNIYTRSSVLNTFTRTVNYGKVPLIACIFFTPHYRNKLVSAGITQETVDELFPLPRMGAIVEQAMLGSK